ncbi:MAG: NUDIX hydrolase [Nitrososphaerota archaeon]|nr:NUDIX hydrolase [Nitrososphaerales archaeon]MDW8044584.1 NUDIX hydrolase [Nitrososphaerota archaeon]
MGVTLRRKVERIYPDRPIAAVGAVIKKEDKVLLVKRRFEPGVGKWSIPGGLIELGEKVHDAVVREVREEVGLVVKIERLIDVVDNIVYDEEGRIKYHYVIADYLVCPISGELKTSDEVVELKWVTKEDLKGLDLTRTCRRLLEQIGFINE